jgi:hypothetical protein
MQYGVTVVVVVEAIVDYKSVLMREQLMGLGVDYGCYGVVPQIDTLLKFRRLAYVSLPVRCAMIWIQACRLDELADSHPPWASDARSAIASALLTTTAARATGGQSS